MPFLPFPWVFVQELVKKEDLCLHLWEDQREDSFSRIVVDDSLERQQSKHLTHKKKTEQRPNGSRILTTQPSVSEKWLSAPSARGSHWGGVGTVPAPGTILGT